MSFSNPKYLGGVRRLFRLLAVAAAFSLQGGLLADDEDASDHHHDDDHDQVPAAAPATDPPANVYDEHPRSHHESGDHVAQPHSDSVPFDWRYGEGANIGGFLFPELFVQGVFGDSTTDPALLAVGHHDPQTQAMLQSFHFATFLKIGELLTGFANYEGVTDANGKFEGIIEEGFAHLHLFDWLAIGGGQFLNSFGFQNERHVHAWDFVDQYLVNGHMLNEGELTTRGGEVIVKLPTPWESSLTVGGGGLSMHDEDEPGHGHRNVGTPGLDEAAFEAHGAEFENWVVSANYRADYGADENMAGTISAAVGENGFGRITQVYGIGHEIVWNPEQPLFDDTKNVVIGQYRGGTFGTGSLRWRTELMARSIEAVGDADHHEEADHGHEHHEENDGGERYATLEELGIYTQLQYGVTDLTTAGLRGEWVSGINEMGLDERWRVSPAVGVFLNPARTIHLRLQYNFDYAEAYKDEHSVWLQIGFAWGAPGDHLHRHH